MVTNKNIKENKWNERPNCEIFYVSNKTKLSKVINSIEFDQYYLNSLFDYNYSIKVILLYKFNLIPQKPILLAPRGELMEGALSIKSLKKRLFLSVFKILRLYKNLTWHASSEYETDDIKREFGENSKIKIALDVPNYNLRTDFVRTHRKKKGKLKVLFISSIVPKKNLKYVIEVLNKVEGDFILDVYGPIKDKKYWKECQNSIDDKIKDKVKYKGTIPNNEIHKIYPNYDLFFFPTLGENYGHVIYESLFYGCPVLLSDQTPWDKLEDFNCGWNIRLNSSQRFKDIIEELIYFEEKKYFFLVIGCSNYITNLKKDRMLKDNMVLFE